MNLIQLELKCEEGQVSLFSAECLIIGQDRRYSDYDERGENTPADAASQRYWLSRFAFPKFLEEEWYETHTQTASGVCHCDDVGMLHAAGQRTGG